MRKTLAQIVQEQAAEIASLKSKPMASAPAPLSWLSEANAVALKAPAAKAANVKTYRIYAGDFVVEKGRNKGTRVAGVYVQKCINGTPVTWPNPKGKFLTRDEYTAVLGSPRV